MELFETLAARCSYRGMYQKTPVPRSDLIKILEAGLSAPSGCNVQTARFIALDDPDKVAEVTGLLNKPNFASAPAGIVVLTRPVPAYRGEVYNVQDYAAAIENMLLSITALGYASCWVEGYVTHFKEIAEGMAKVLNVPEEYSVVAYLPVGVPAEEMRHVEKMPFDERAWFNGYMEGN